ncbi:LPXTG cell wall anchor domain-containing protein [Bifidobacterium apri]
MTVIIALMALVVAPGTAMAGIGSQGAGISGSGGPMPDNDALFLFDNKQYGSTPTQGWGETSIDYAYQSLVRSGVLSTWSGNKPKFYGSCRDAVSHAIADRSDGEAKQARVVGVALSLKNSSLYGTNPRDFRARFDTNWDRLAADGLGNDLIGWDGDWINRLRYQFNEQIATTGRAYPAGVQVVCVAANELQPTAQYPLSITTQQQAPADMSVGDVAPVHDTIITNNDGSVVKEQLDAQIWLNYDGHPAGLHAARAIHKTMRLPNAGTTNSPQFAPSDFGWDGWQEGSYWFDVVVPGQGRMAATVNTEDRQASESFRVESRAPGAPSKSVDEGVSADGMTNRTNIVTGTGRGGYRLGIVDTITPGDTSYRIGGYRVTDMTDGTDRTAEFTFDWNRDAHTVSAQWSAESGMLPQDHALSFSFDVTVDTPGHGLIRDTAAVHWNDEPARSTEDRQFPTWRPQPDTVWALRGEDGAWDAVIDPEHGNAVGAAGRSLLDGDAVAVATNAVIAAHLIESPQRLELTAGWSQADYLFDPDGEAAIRVYEADTTHERASGVFDIARTGKDVTGEFAIRINDGTATAVASQAYLASVQGLGTHRQLTLLVPGRINLAHGKGAIQVRKDYRVEDGHAVQLCSSSHGTAFSADGSHTVNDHRVDANKPSLCAYIPPANKQVLAHAEHGGNRASIDQAKVMPGQRVTYVLSADITPETGLGYRLEHVDIVDEYDRYLEPDEYSVIVRDNATGTVFGRQHYSVDWDRTNHRFRIVFTRATIDTMWNSTQTTPRLTVEFDGTVSEHAPANRLMANQWTLGLNNSVTPSNRVVIEPPRIVPEKTVTQAQASIDIDGRTALLGDTVYYRVTLDASDVESSAYTIQRLGIIDDYDERYLALDADRISITDERGNDCTKAFNIQDAGGVLYAFFKTVDTIDRTTGKVIAARQPDDMKTYASASLDPHTDPAIDQQVLGKRYELVLPMTVTAVGDGVTVRNSATQVTGTIRTDTRTVVTALQPVNPTKDVSIAMQGDSVNGADLPLHTTFLYRLDSSDLPSERAYDVGAWNIRDDYDELHDVYLGQWVAVARHDMVINGKAIASGDIIERHMDGELSGASQTDVPRGGGDVSELLFDVTEQSGVVLITLTDQGRRVFGGRDRAAGWTIFIQMQRVLPGERIVNGFTETINGVERMSNEVWTRTIHEHGAIELVKFDEASGEQEGDRDTAEQALDIMQEETTLVFRIRNVGDVPVTGLRLNDTVTIGNAAVAAWRYPEHWDDLVLEPGQSVDVTGVLSGVDGAHADHATVTAATVVTCPMVDDNPFDDQPAVRQEGVCRGDTVSSGDYWHGRRIALAKTGAWFIPTAILGFVAVAAATGMLVLLVALRRRRG